jgi:acetyltransferase EpsM
MSEARVHVAGTRTFSAEVADFARDAGWRVVGLLEPAERERVGQTIHDLPVTWLDDPAPATGAVALLGTGEPARRELVERLRAAGWQTGTLIHPRAHVAPSASVGAGTVIAPGAVVGACARIGEHVVVGRGALIGHHTAIADFATLGPGSNVAGNVELGADAFVGMGALVRDHAKIGGGATIAMGAVVVGDVAADTEVRGVPARPR